MPQFKDKVFRARAEHAGAHYHVKVSSADRPDHTFAVLGTLVMDEHDYNAFTKSFKAEHILEQL
jgi:hypothetical protein